jgi:hypothetical protein
MPVCNVKLFTIFIGLSDAMDLPIAPHFCYRINEASINIF